MLHVELQIVPFIPRVWATDGGGSMPLLAWPSSSQSVILSMEPFEFTVL